MKIDNSGLHSEAGKWSFADPSRAADAANGCLPPVLPTGQKCRQIASEKCPVLKQRNITRIIRFSGAIEKTALLTVSAQSVVQPARRYMSAAAELG